MKPLQKYIFKYFFADEVFKKCFEPFLDGYEIELETSMKGNDWIYDYVNLLYYKCHKINLKGLLFTEKSSYKEKALHKK